MNYSAHGGVGSKKVRNRKPFAHLIGIGYDKLQTEAHRPPQIEQDSPMLCSLIHYMKNIIIYSLPI